MNEFIKIFFGLFIIAGSFYAGQNYGQKQWLHTEDYKKLKELKQNYEFQFADKSNLKAKIENVLISGKLNQDNEVIKLLAQYFGESWEFNKKPVQENLNKEANVNKIQNETGEPSNKEELKIDSSTEARLKKIKTFEWMIDEAETKSELLSALSKTKIKKADNLSVQSAEISESEINKYKGRYKGHVLGSDLKPWATMSLDLTFSESKLQKKMKIFRDGKELLPSKDSQILAVYKPKGLSAMILEDENTIMQIYKNKNTQQLAGHYYEILVNGTTKEIGSFVLQKIPDFSEE